MFVYNIGQGVDISSQPATVINPTTEANLNVALRKVIFRFTRRCKIEGFILSIIVAPEDNGAESLRRRNLPAREKA